MNLFVTRIGIAMVHKFVVLFSIITLPKISRRDSIAVWKYYWVRAMERLLTYGARLAWYFITHLMGKCRDNPF
jgi:hypothetical protein